MPNDTPTLRPIPVRDLLRTEEQRTRFTENMDLAEAAALIRRMRQQARRGDNEFGITQAELAARIGVSQSRISQLESAEGRDGPTFALLKKIAGGCDVVWTTDMVRPRSRDDNREKDMAALVPLFEDMRNFLAAWGAGTAHEAAITVLYTLLKRLSFSSETLSEDEVHKIFAPLAR